jgi:hypothetical protein
MACPKDVDGENSLQLWRVAADTLNKQPLTIQWVILQFWVGHGAKIFSS